MIRKFNEHPNAQAWVIEHENGDKRLVSYNTTVCAIYGDWLVVYGLFSATTRKHIGWFMRELGLDYQLAKALYEMGYTMNIKTGEIQPES